MTNPPLPPKAEADDAKQNNRHFPCPSCGADLRFHPGEAQMLCTHCDTRVEVPHVDDEAAQVEHGLLDHIADEGEMTEVEVQALNCSTCGASIEFDPEEHSRLCPFCDSAIVADVTTQRRIVPQGILPFAIMERQAHEHMAAWLKSRWFAPNDIENDAAAESFSGVYVPLWTYDSQVDTRYTGQRGTRVRSGKRSYTKWTNVSGKVYNHFDDVLVSGSSSVSAEFKDALAPWTLEGLETYQTEFLAGFRAENHTVSISDGFSEAKKFMKLQIKTTIKSHIGGSKQKISTINSEYSGQSFKHILLPVWITHYSLEKARYRLSVNGHTGKVYGQRPFSKLKLLGASFVLTLGSGALGFVISIAMGA